MAEAIKMMAELKMDIGKGPSRAVRRAGRVPCIIYGGKEQKMVSLELKEFLKIFNMGNIQSRLFNLELGGKKIDALAKDVQLDPVTDTPIHIDFQEVNVKTPIKVEVHIKLINEEKAPGVKKGGVLNVAHRMVAFMVFPNNIPEHIVVDVAGLEIGRSINIEDLKLPEGVIPVDKSNFVLVSITGRSEEKESTASEPEAEAAKA